jgi:ABC-2 type transport system permease protein
VQQTLGENYTVKRVDLTSGRVPGDVDMLLIIAAQGMTEEERFAVDQYLMRGGAVVVAAGNYVLAPQQFPGGLTMEAVQDGLQEMLKYYGIEVEATMVMDPRNEPFPVQVQRQVSGIQVIEIQELNYPFFVDVRPDSMDKDNPIVSRLPAVTLQWVSPLKIDEALNTERETTVLLRSSDESWLRTSIDVMPNTELYGDYGFPVEGELEARPLAVAVRGSFESYFKDRASPFQEETVGATESLTATVEPPRGTIEVSPDSSRLIVVGSAEFIDDTVLDISSRLSADRYLNSLQFVQNAVDWSVEDQDLLSIRSRGTFARLLKPLEQKEQSFWEVLNYALALVALIAIGVVWSLRRRSEEPMFDVQGSRPDERASSNAQGGSDE